MAAHQLAVCCFLLALTGSTAFRTNTAGNHSQGLVNAKASATVEVADLKAADLTKLMTLGVGTITSMITAFSETPPDYEYAVDSLNSNGWMIVTTLVPKRDQMDAGFRNARSAWRAVFADAVGVIEELTDAVKDGGPEAVTRALLNTCDKALAACGEGFPQERTVFSAIGNLVHGTGSTILDFLRAMGVFDKASSLVQLGTDQDKIDFSLLLTTSTGIITSLISAFSGDEPDLEYAFDSLRLQGWKVVKIVVPQSEHQSKNMKNGKKAWDRLFEDAQTITEDTIAGVKEKSVAKLVKATLDAVQTGLMSTADLLEDKRAFLEALAKLISGVGETWLEFGMSVGWVH